MASPLLNFSGLASGIDTNAIVEGLMQVERSPITRLQIRRAGYDDKLDAWTAITSKVGEFRSSADAISTSGDFDEFVSATTSDEDAISVTVTGRPSPATISLTVNTLAATHQVSSGAGFTATDALVGSGTFSVTTATGTSNIATDSSTTLTGLAQSINSADLGVVATIVQVTDTDHRLLLSASDSGFDGTFSVSSDIAGFASSSTTISVGADASVRLGDPVNGLDVSRSTNTFANVIDGVTFDIRQVTAGAITLDVVRDNDAIETAITSMVNAANGVLTEIAKQTAYNADSDTASALTNDRAARDMAFELQSVLSGSTSGGSITHLGQLGIEYGREGVYTVDSTKLRETLESDLGGVLEYFVRSGTQADSRVQYLNATGETVQGSYEVIATTAADVPTIVGTPYVPSASFEDFNIRFGTKNALVGIGQNSSLADAITQINDGLAILGITEILAEQSAGAIKLSAGSFYGSAYDIAVWNDGLWGLDNVSAGVDIAGTIGGESATGVGRTLSATAGNPTGMSVLISATAAELAGGPLSLGNIDFAQGLAGGIDGFLDRIEGIDGDITRARAEWDSRIEIVDDSIESMEIRMVTREQQLRREFTAMETALSQLQNQSSFLSGFLQPQSSQ
jgi:flagellar hook-associated protein 2